MSGLLFIKQQPLSIFYKRRISRVFPVFYFLSFRSIALPRFLEPTSHQQSFLRR